MWRSLLRKYAPRLARCVLPLDQRVATWYGVGWLKKAKAKGKGGWEKGCLLILIHASLHDTT